MSNRMELPERLRRNWTTVGDKFSNERLLSEDERWQLSTEKVERYTEVFQEYDQLRKELNTGTIVDLGVIQRLRELGEELDKIAGRSTQENSQFGFGKNK